MRTDWREGVALVCFGGIIVLVLAALTFGFTQERLDPAKVCREHHGVQRVLATGRKVNGVICRDGYWERSR